MKLYQLIILCVVLLFAGIALGTFLGSCAVEEAAELPGSTGSTGETETDPALSGTIVCFEPWSTGGTFNLPGREIYRDSISHWGAEGWPDGNHLMWEGSAGTSARTGRGYVHRTGITVVYSDGNGNRVHLINYPCRITMFGPFD